MKEQQARMDRAALMGKRFGIWAVVLVLLGALAMIAALPGWVTLALVCSAIVAICGFLYSLRQYERIAFKK